MADQAPMDITNTIIALVVLGMLLVAQAGLYFFENGMIFFNKAGQNVIATFNWFGAMGAGVLDAVSMGIAPTDWLTEGG